MYSGEQPELSQNHHLPIMAEDDTYDYHHDEYDPHTPYPPSAEGHHQLPPPATPQQPPKPFFSPHSRPPSKKRTTPTSTPSLPQMSIPTAKQPLQPPQPIFLPSSPPPKRLSPPHHHHDNNRYEDDDNHHHEYDPHSPYPPSAEGHHQPPLPATPQQPLQPPEPFLSPHSRQPSKKRATPPPPQMSIPPPQQPLQPPQPIFLPTSPPPKPRPPPHHHHGNNRYDDNSNRRNLLFVVITILLLLLGLTALILWLLYRPSKPHFTAVSAAVYSLNTTFPPPYVTASLQITVLSRNPSKRTSLYYDNLSVTVHYYNHPITPQAALPPLHHLKRSTVIISPEIGGGLAVEVPPEVVEGLAADEADGVVGLSWVLVGRVKYRAGWFRSGHNRVYVRCDVMLGFKSGGGNPSCQVPLLGNPPCFVDIGSD